MPDKKIKDDGVELKKGLDERRLEENLLLLWQVLGDRPFEFNARRS
jgi:hypothetical protein